MEAEAPEDQLGNAPSKLIHFWVNYLFFIRIDFVYYLAAIKKDVSSTSKQGKAGNWSPRHRASVAGLTHQQSLQQPAPVPLAAASSSPNITVEPIPTSLSSPSTVPIPSASIEGDNDQLNAQDIQAKTIVNEN